MLQRPAGVFGRSSKLQQQLLLAYRYALIHNAYILFVLEQVFCPGAYIQTRFLTPVLYRLVAGSLIEQLPMEKFVDDIQD
ncbi:hypothetical protein [Hallella multisaccharivorax]|uniref:hypothetical protein n=1 Tax=Hallella multisaccharivorax TaxID=310514 RepID=UPI00361DF7EE